MAHMRATIPQTVRRRSRILRGSGVKGASTSYVHKQHSGGWIIMWNCDRISTEAIDASGVIRMPLFTGSRARQVRLKVFLTWPTTGKLQAGSGIRTVQTVQFKWKYMTEILC